ncbi:MAG: sigma-54 interaction domain-containing protein [Fidelibacterota bacterium]
MTDLGQVRKLSGILGNSDAIEQVLEMTVQIAPVDMSVLISGESGTGKEMVARAIHRMSRRSNRPMLTVNCGAIPEGIIESELFGHKKGAFTGSTEDRKGYFEEAHMGTLLLDEIGEMPLGTQVKLLRVLETGEFMRVGETRTRKADVRVIAATNKDLAKECEKGSFRKDLYFRLRTVTIDMPPLRHRLEDLDLLVERFALEFSRSNDIVFRGFTSDAIRVMKQYDWPGNVRELKNFVERVIVLEKGNRLSSDHVLKHLSPMVGEASPNLPVPIDKESDQAERELILHQLLFLRKDVRDLRSILTGENLDRTGEVGSWLPGEVLTRPSGEVITRDPDTIVHSGAVGEVSLKDVEKELIERTLKKFNNNRRKTAEVLKVSERTLYRKINEYGLEKKQKPRSD